MSEELLTRLEVLLAAATKGEWQLQDGCSWRRIGAHFHDGDVLCPIKQRDGHPDLCAADGKVYANLELIVAAVNALPSLIAEARQSAIRVKELEEALRPFAKYGEGVGCFTGSNQVFEMGYSSSVVGDRHLSEEDFRRARSVLEGRG